MEIPNERPKGTYVEARWSMRTESGKRRIIITVPMPSFNRVHDEFCRADVKCLLRAYVNITDFAKLLGECIWEKPALDLLKDRWIGTEFPYEVLYKDDFRARRVIYRVEYLLHRVLSTCEELFARRCSKNFDVWWQPDLLAVSSYQFLQAYCPEHEAEWGPYFAAWRLQNPNVQLIHPAHAERRHKFNPDFTWLFEELEDLS